MLRLLPTAVTRAFAALSLQGSAAKSSSNIVIQQQQRPLCAVGWAEFVNRRYDPKTQAWKSEDPENSVKRIQHETNSTGTPILSAPKNQRTARHVKPTTKKKELANRVHYLRKRKQVMDLIKYIHFVKDHKDKDNW